MFAVTVTLGFAFLIAEQTLNQCFNITTNERINRKRYTWLMNPATGKFENKFDRGKIKNILEFWQCSNDVPDYYQIYPDDNRSVSSSDASRQSTINI